MGDQPRIFASAFLCEKVLTEGTVLSAIRIVDIFTAQVPPAQQIEDKRLNLVMQLDAILLVLLKSAEEISGDVWISLEGPDGKLRGGKRGPFHAEIKDAPGGTNLNITIHMNVATMPDGIYWFNVEFNDELVQRCPMTLKRVELPAEALQMFLATQDDEVNAGQAKKSES